MVTYPSTHGAYEDTISDLCKIVHDHGGQVYVDGANLNALLGYAKPGEFGGDVSHLNLHKTFCIPHGGGGPGVGPVAVRAHLAPYLPSHGMHPDPAKRDGHRPDQRGALRIGGHPAHLLGLCPADGRRGPHPRHGDRGAVGQLRRGPARRALPGPLPRARWPGGPRVHPRRARPTKDTGVTVDDVAKRLIDYGFHAPTMSFPVAGTLMVEPTESEDLGEIDRFCDAMIAIKAEIDRVGAGEWAPETSPLRGAPHTSRALVGEWDRADTPASSRPSRPDRTRTSTGPRWRASTRRTATATWSAPARPRRPSPSSPRLDPARPELREPRRHGPPAAGGVVPGGRRCS